MLNIDERLCIHMLRVKYKTELAIVTTHILDLRRASAPDLITENIADLAVPVFVIDMRKPHRSGDC